jgi:hypothetical protein
MKLITEEFGTLRGAVKRHIESTFITAWDTYLQRQRDKELSLALKKKTKEVIQTQAIEEADMEIDAELPASRQQLQDLIQREAKKLARSMIQKEATMQVKHALKNTPGGNPRRPPHQRKHDKRKEMDQMLESPEAQRPLDRPKPEQTSAPTLGPTTETTRLHRVATVPTGTIEMVNKTVATIASHIKRSNAISSSDSRTAEETTGQANQTPLLVENTSGVELHACVPDQGTGAAMGADRAMLFALVERSIKAAFGFVADPCLSTKHNASNYLATMPLWLYFQRPTTMAFHDLTTRLKPPKNLRSLIGLNLKFVPNPRTNVPWRTYSEEVLPR